MEASEPVAAETTKRSAILKAAKQAFLHRGYEVSLDVIADSAGVARRTVFNNFGTKERLFREIIEAMTAEAMPLLTLDPQQAMAPALLRYAQTYVGLVVSPETLEIQRMLLAGAPNLLEQMTIVVERNYVRLIADLAKYFEGKITAGEMRPVNVAHAAERFLTSVLGMARVHLMLGIAPEDSDRELYIREAVTGFLDGVAPSGSTAPRNEVGG
jgi:TetR/AcrR family transcriptional repressor of mexJK operon